MIESPSLHKSESEIKPESLQKQDHLVPIFQNLVKNITRDLSQVDHHSGAPTVVTSHRHLQLLVQTIEHLETFLNPELTVDMACEELRLSLHLIGSITEF